MNERVQITAEEIGRALDEEELRDWVQHQRWYASKARHVAGIDIVESITLRDDPLLLLALVQTRFATGTHELYQLPLALRPPEEVTRGESIAHTDEWTVYDALAERSSCCAGSRPPTRSPPPTACSASISSTAPATLSDRRPTSG